MKAILKYSLYKRSQPTNEVEANGYLEVNSVIEVNQIVSGKALDGVSIWFFSDDGFYYWGGGADFSDDQIYNDWNKISPELRKDLLSSLVSDELFWFQKKVSGYVGCGWGYKNDDLTRGLAVSVFVDQKTNIGSMGNTVRYKGFDIPVDVKEVGDFDHLVFRNNVNDIAPDITHPMDMGGSISLEGSQAYGTRSMLLVNDKNVNCLITCFHVLFNTANEKGEITVLDSDPRRVETPCRFRNPFSNHVQIRNGLQIIEGKYNAFYDYAAVGVPNGVSFSNGFGDIKFNGFYMLGDLRNLQNQSVTMAGAKSNKQWGKVLDVGKSMLVEKSQTFNDVVVTEKISERGDSGAPVVDSENKLVGIVIAGNKHDNKTLILPVSYLFTLLGYKLL